MNKDKLLEGHLTDLARRAYDKNIYTYSGFLSMPEQALLNQIQDEIRHVPYTLFGGYQMAERRMVGFGSEEIFGYSAKFPISTIRISPVAEKFSDELTHRDYLGALMHLGIDRSTLGDIRVQGKDAYLYCTDEISGYILDELCKVKHTQVSTSLIDGDAPELVPTFTELSCGVSSLRLDVVIAAVCQKSRKDVSGFFERSEVQLNGAPASRSSVLLKEGDTFSVRGLGKYSFDGTGGTSRRGKVYVNLRRYE